MRDVGSVPPLSLRVVGMQKGPIPWEPSQRSSLGENKLADGQEESGGAFQGTIAGDTCIVRPPLKKKIFSSTVANPVYFLQAMTHSEATKGPAWRPLGYIMPR